MLDFGFSEILLTSAIALIVLGPERLPKVARQVGNWVGRARIMARQLTEQLEREVSVDELMKERSKSKALEMNRVVPTQHAPSDSPAPAPESMAAPPDSRPSTLPEVHASHPVRPPPQVADKPPNE